MSSLASKALGRARARARAWRIHQRKRCVVHLDKITKYLLNLEHPDGGPKAQFFQAGGFSLDEPEKLREALIAHYRNNKPSSHCKDRFGGTKIVIDASMQVPDGRTPIVRSVWRIEPGMRTANFVTAYPQD